MPADLQTKEASGGTNKDCVTSSGRLFTTSHTKYQHVISTRKPSRSLLARVTDRLELFLFFNSRQSDETAEQTPEEEEAASLATDRKYFCNLENSAIALESACEEGGGISGAAPLFIFSPLTSSFSQKQSGTLDWDVFSAQVKRFFNPFHLTGSFYTTVTLIKYICKGNPPLLLFFYRSSTFYHRRHRC